MGAQWCALLMSSCLRPISRRSGQLGPVADSIARPLIRRAALALLMGCDGVDCAVEQLIAQLHVKVDLVWAAGGILCGDRSEHATAKYAIRKLGVIDQSLQLIA